MPRFSIIIPFKNAAETLGATLLSIRAQTFTDWEAICIDDHSQDISAEIVAAFAARDRRIRLVTNSGTGPSAARNYGAELAAAKLIAFCDADDLWAADKLETLAQAFRSGTANAYYGQIGFFKASAGDCFTRSQVLERPLTVRDLLGENPVCTLSNLTLETTIFRELGGFDINATHNEDLEFLIRLVGEGHTLAAIDRLQVWYRTTPTGLSSNLAAMLEGRKRAIATAARYDVLPSAAQEAVYMRYLARRSLRLDSGILEPLAFTRTGLQTSARAFLTPLRRGGATAAAALVAPCLPRPIRHVLFTQ